MRLECAFPLSDYASWRDIHSLLATMMTHWFTWWWPKASAIMPLGIWIFRKYKRKDLSLLCCSICNITLQTPRLKKVIAHTSLTTFRLYKWKLNRPLRPLLEYAEVLSYLFLTVCRYVYGDCVPTCSCECIWGTSYTCRCVTCQWKPEVLFRCFTLSLSIPSFKTKSLTEPEVYLLAKTRWPVNPRGPPISTSQV